MWGRIHSDLSTDSYPLDAPWLSGWLILLVTIFMREFSASLFLSSAENEPIGPLLFWLYQDGFFGTVAALGVLVSVVSTCLVIVAMRYARLEKE